MRARTWLRAHDFRYDIGIVRGLDTVWDSAVDALAKQGRPLSKANWLAPSRERVAPGSS